MNKKIFTVMLFWNLAVISLVVVSPELFVRFNYVNVFSIHAIILAITFKFAIAFSKTVKETKTIVKFKQADFYKLLETILIFSIVTCFLAQSYNSIFYTDKTEDILRWNSFSIAYSLIILIISFILFSSSQSILKTLVNFFKKIYQVFKYLFTKYLRKVKYFLVLIALKLKINYLKNKILNLSIKSKIVKKNDQILKSVVWVNRNNNLLIL